MNSTKEAIFAIRVIFGETNEVNFIQQGFAGMMFKYHLQINSTSDVACKARNWLRLLDVQLSIEQLRGRNKS